LVLREGHLAAALTQARAARPISALVAVDGSLLAETAMLPAIHLMTALAAPGPAAVHLTQIVKPFSQTTEEGVVRELDQETLQHAKAYLARVKERLEERLPAPQPVITWSVARDADVASTLIRIAEHGESSEGVGSSEVIAMSTHGRGGVQRLIMGSVTHRVLETTKLPMLVIKPVQLESGLA
jgi:nucleotide-binding universal stress UspA family protein